MSEETSTKTVAQNRRAFHDYGVDERLECGVALQGTEVKSVRAAQISFSDAYARITDGQLELVGFHITPYDHASFENHDPDRTRRLLAHRAEIKRLHRKVQEKGYTLIPLRILLKGGLVKVEIGLCKGKRSYDKREDIKRRDMKREADREIRDRMR